MWAGSLSRASEFLAFNLPFNMRISPRKERNACANRLKEIRDGGTVYRGMLYLPPAANSSDGSTGRGYEKAAKGAMIYLDC
jgi:hypothetical protein